MRVFDVIDADGKPLAIFMIDPWKRDNKNGGAWMSNLVNQSYLRGTKPVVFNVENFTKPAPGQPALISWDDVTTMFHEFGHALHGMFAAQTYPTLSGHQRRPRLRRVPLAVQRELGARSEDPAALRRPLQDRPDDPAGPGRQGSSGADLQPGLRSRRSARGGAARPRLALAARDRRRCRTSTSSRRRRWRTAASTPPTSRRAIARATSSTSGATAIRPAITLTRGPGCSARTRSPGSSRTAG